MAHSRATACYIVESTFEDMNAESLAQLKIRVLDSVGCCIGAIDAATTRVIRE
ncbi:MAG TPA: hypothetical protein VFF30_11475 [Nitrososphaerales archaeon]|nr:hypothetical protein [Nitrososphaerales archaeon]